MWLVPLYEQVYHVNRAIGSDTQPPSRKCWHSVDVTTVLLVSCFVL
jgi:hypothetical protein